MDTNAKPAWDAAAWERSYAEQGKAAQAWAQAHGIALRAVKIFLAGSEETTCFTATLTRAGKVVGTAQNHGQGGMTIVQTTDPVLRAAMEEAQWEGGDNPLTRYVDDMVEAESLRKEQARILSRIRQSARKRGRKVIAFKIEGATIQNADSSNPDPNAMRAWLSGKGEVGWTVEVL